MTKQIPLTQGKAALVDDGMYDYLAQWKWHYVNGYAVRSETVPGTGKQKAVFMHRVIANAPHGVEVDHVHTEEKLNNTRQNLRACTHAENQHNRRKYANNSSGYKGVASSGTKWRAIIRNQGVRLHIGVFDTPEDAARAYD